jgi:hypothetical protein
LNGKTVRIFAVGYEAEYLGGEITRGSHHDEVKWVNVQDFKPEDFFVGGWLKGMQEYWQQLINERPAG